MFYMEEQNQFVLSLYTYIENVYTFDAPVEEFARIAGEEISPRAEEDVMTMAERLREEGQYKEKIEIAKRLLANGTEPAFVAKVTELSLAQIKSLQKIISH